MRISETKDSIDVLIKEGDKLSFMYNETTIETEVKYHNGHFIVVSPNNYPISCMLADLYNHTDNFTII